MGVLVALPIAAAIAILDKRKIEDFVFLAIGIIVTLIIAAGFFGNTMYGVKAGVILGGISLLYCLCMLIKDFNRFKKCVFTPGLLAGGIYIILSGALYIGRPDLGGDNDAFWYYAPQVLNLYRYSDLGNTGARAGVFSLLYTAPVFTGWCYFCNKIWFVYSDGINLWARQLFIFAGLMPILGLAKRRDGKKLFLLLLIVLILPLLVVDSQSFMIDIPMGATMVYGTIMTVKLFRSGVKYNDWGYLVGICISIMLLSIMKRAGGIYTYGIVSITVVYTIKRIQSKEDRFGIFRKVFPFICMCIAVLLSMSFCVYRRIYFEKNLFYFIFPILGLFIFIVVGVFCSISIRLVEQKKYLGVTVFWGIFYIGMVYIIRVLAAVGRVRVLKENAENVDNVFFNFFSWWFTKGRFESGWAISDHLYILILAFVVIGARELIKHHKNEAGVCVADFDTVMFPVFIGYVVYMMFYCFIYMFQQSGYLVNGDIGWTDRYLGPPLMLTTAVVLYELLHIKCLNAKRVLFCMLVFLLLIKPNNPFAFLSLKSENYWEKYGELYKMCEMEPQEDERFFCVGPDHCQYYVFPAWGPIDYMANNAEYEPEELEEIVRLGHFKYLLLEDYAWSFPDKYQDLFIGGKASIQKWAIYDITFDSEGQMRFVKRGGL